MSSIFIPILGAALSAAAAGSARSQSADDEITRNAFASFQAGNWHGEAALFGANYDFGPQYQCRISTPGAALIQIRARESSALQGSWRLLPELRDLPPVVDWVRVNGRRYEVARVPWRLEQPTDDGIMLTFDRMMLAVRAEAHSQWLPFEYLTLQLLDAPSFEIGYHAQDDDSAPRVPGRRTINLIGFKEVASWCGRMLLRDRQDEDRVRELTN